VTEEEAKTKWCPFARTEVFDAQGGCSGGNRGGGITSCIGSACMAFRFLPDATLEMSGHVVTTDEIDADLLGESWWGGRYAKREDGYLHRRIAERVYGDIPAGMFVDHIDGDPTNNRRGNLRIVSKAENAANAAARGVSPARNGRWQAQISREGIRMHLGTFDTEELAAAAYDEAAKRVHGEFARPNLQQQRNVGRSGFCGLAGKP